MFAHNWARVQQWWLAFQETHSLHTWSLVPNPYLTVKGGYCNLDTHTVQLAKKLLSDNGVHQGCLWDLLVHETAHAIHYQHPDKEDQEDHGQQWAAYCRVLGGTGWVPGTPRCWTKL